MRKKISIAEIIKSTNANVVHDGKYKYVKWVVASGLMSDVLTTEKEEILLITSLSTPQVVRTADMVGAHAVLIACGKPVPQETVSLARDLDINLLSSKSPVFETCCSLSEIFFED